MRHLLLLLLLLAPHAGAQEVQRAEAGHANGGVEPALLPHARPALVEGELTTPRFRILHTQKATGAARTLSEGIEAVRDGFVDVLGRDWPGVTEIRIGVGREEFEALALPGGAPPGWAVALAYPAHNIVLLNALTLSGPEGHTTLLHELAHVALGQLGRTWPRWFQEGLAQHLTGERVAVTHYAALFRAVSQERVFHFEDLADGWPDRPLDVQIAYAQSADFVAYLAAKHGPEGMGRLVDEVGAGEPFERAFGKAFRSSLLVEEMDWHGGLSFRYGWLPLTTSMSLVWLGATGLLVAAYVRRRKQKAAKLEAMAAEDAAEDEALRQLSAISGLPPLAEPQVPEWYEPPPSEHPPSAEDDEDTPGRPPKPTLH